MPPALEGLLYGAGLAVLLLFAEYWLQRRIAVARAQEKKRAVELEPEQRRRIASMARFCIFIPPAFAAAFWLIFR